MIDPVQAVAGIVIETVSPSTRRFHCHTPFIPCTLHDTEMDEAYEKMCNESTSDEERERFHDRFHELEVNGCSINQAIAKLDESEEKNLLLGFSHSCKGSIDIVFNLAVIDTEQISYFEEQIVQIITNAQLLEQTLPVRRVGP